MSPYNSLSPESKPAAFPHSRSAAPAGKIWGRGYYFQLGAPLQAGAGAVWGRWGRGWLPSSSFRRLAGKVSMETAALVSPEIWGETGSKKSPSSFLGGRQHSLAEKRGAWGERVLEKELVSPRGPRASGQCPPLRAPPPSPPPPVLFHCSFWWPRVRPASFPTCRAAPSPPLHYLSAPSPATPSWGAKPSPPCSPAPPFLAAPPPYLLTHYGDAPAQLPAHCPPLQPWRERETHAWRLLLGS